MRPEDSRGHKPLFFLTNWAIGITIAGFQNDNGIPKSGKIWDKFGDDKFGDKFGDRRDIHQFPPV